MSEQQSNQLSLRAPVIHIQQLGGTRFTYGVESGVDVVPIGRAEENLIVVRRDPGVADYHLEILFEGDRVLAVDLGSNSGTYMGSEQLAPLQPVEWQIGQPLRIGSHFLLWAMTDNRDAIDPATPSVATPLTSVVVGEPPGEAPLDAAEVAEIDEAPLVDSPISALPGHATQRFDEPASTPNAIHLRPVEQQHWYITPGVQIPARYIITNRSTQRERFTLAVGGIPTEWYVIASAIELEPGEAGELVVSLKPPRSPLVVPGAHIIEVWAVGQNQGTQSEPVRGVIETQSFSAFQSQLLHSPVSGVSSPGAHDEPEAIEVSVENQGNLSERFTLDWLSDSGQLDFSPLSSTLDLAPGATGSVRSVAIAQSHLPSTIGQSYPFTVAVHNQSGQSSVKQGHFFRSGMPAAQPLAASPVSARSGCMRPALWGLLLLLLPCLICGVFPLLYFSGFEVGGLGIGDTLSRVADAPSLLWERLTNREVDPTVESGGILATPGDILLQATTSAPENSPASLPLGDASSDSGPETENVIPMPDVAGGQPAPIATVESSDASASVPSLAASWVDDLVAFPGQLWGQITGADRGASTGQGSEPTRLEIDATRSAAAYATAVAEVTQSAMVAATATAIWQGLDDDNDGLVNGDELLYRTALNSPDTDQDGLSDLDEVRRGTNPRHFDSDGDGLSDLAELQQGRDPLISQAAAIIPTPFSTPIPFVAATPFNSPTPLSDPIRGQKITYISGYRCTVNTGYDDLMLRNGPGTHYSIVARLHNGSTLHPIAYQSWPQSSYQWVYVQIPGPQSCQGWVNTAWINCVEQPSKENHPNWKKRG